MKPYFGWKVYHDDRSMRGREERKVRLHNLTAMEGSHNTASPLSTHACLVGTHWSEIDKVLKRASRIATHRYRQYTGIGSKLLWIEVTRRPFQTNK
jgi:hypothetical protein